MYRIDRHGEPSQSYGAIWDRYQRRRKLKKVKEAESCNFSPDSGKLPTENIMGAQRFNFDPKVIQNGVLYF